MERKYKVGDKVKIVKIKDEVHGRASKFLNKTATVTGYWEDCYRLDIDGDAFAWYEDELELVKETLFDRIKSAIIEAGKQAPIIIEQTEDGGVKISPLEEKEEDLPIDTPVIFSNNTDYWGVGIYKGYNKVSGKINGKTEGDKYLYIIPFAKFNPNNIEESLKHNIVK